MVEIGVEDKLWWVSSYFNLGCIGLEDFDEVESRCIYRSSQIAELSDSIGDDACGSEGE